MQRENHQDYGVAIQLGHQRSRIEGAQCSSKLSHLAFAHLASGRRNVRTQALGLVARIGVFPLSHALTAAFQKSTMEDLSNDCMTANCFEAVWTMKRNCLEPRAVLEVSFAFCHRVVNEAFSRSLVSSGDVYAKGAYRATLWPTKEWRDWIVSMLLELSLLLASLTGTPLRPCHIESRSDQTNRQTH